jgi:hypothetical protein
LYGNLVLVRQRLGQGDFRRLVMDTYPGRSHASKGSAHSSLNTSSAGTSSRGRSRHCERDQMIDRTHNSRTEVDDTMYLINEIGNYDGEVAVDDLSQLNY